jgi:hypothetical protein
MKINRFARINGMWFSKELLDDLQASRVTIDYANRETVSLWNANRGDGEPPTFTGFYWYGMIAGVMSEGGPFRTESAAMRDAWYRVCLRKAPPPLRGVAEAQSMVRDRHAAKAVPVSPETRLEAWRRQHRQHA